LGSFSLLFNICLILIQYMGAIPRRRCSCNYHPQKMPCSAVVPLTNRTGDLLERYASHPPKCHEDVLAMPGDSADLFNPRLFIQVIPQSPSPTSSIYAHTHHPSMLLRVRRPRCQWSRLWTEDGNVRNSPAGFIVAPRHTAKSVVWFHSASVLIVVLVVIAAHLPLLGGQLDHRRGHHHPHQPSHP
jgi:hypothetical protein